MVCAPARSVVYEYRISTLLPDVFTSIGLKKGFSTTHPLLDKEISRPKALAGHSQQLAAGRQRMAVSPAKVIPFPANSFIRLSRPQGGLAGLPLEIHPHMLRHSCGFALANMGIDTRLIQDYLGHRNIRHTVWYTASNAGRFYGIWDNPRDKQRSSLIQ